MRENVASFGTCFHIENPHNRFNARSIVIRSIKALVVGSPTTAFATNALANGLRSCGLRPIPSHVCIDHSSIRTQSRMCTSFSSFGVSAPYCCLNSGIKLYCSTCQRRIMNGRCVVFMCGSDDACLITFIFPAKAALRLIFYPSQLIIPPTCLVLQIPQ